MNTYRVLADLIMLLHFVWIIVFVLLGFLSIRYEYYRKFYQMFFVTTFGGQVAFWRCPLTVFENFLRTQYNSNSEQIESFLAHYLGIEISMNISVGIIVIASFVFFVKYKEGIEKKLNVK